MTGRDKPGAAHMHDGGHCRDVSYQAGQRARAVVAVASLSKDAADAAQLLSVLGLSPEEARP